MLYKVTVGCRSIVGRRGVGSMANHTEIQYLNNAGKSSNQPNRLSELTSSLVWSLPKVFVDPSTQGDASLGLN